MPRDIAVLGDAVMLSYKDILCPTITLHKHGLSSYGSNITLPEGLKSVSAISTDGLSRFLVCDGDNRAVFVLDMEGKVCDKISIDTDNEVCDCGVGDKELWVGCRNGDIVIMSL